MENNQSASDLGYSDGVNGHECNETLFEDQNEQMEYFGGYEAGHRVFCE